MCTPPSDKRRHHPLTKAKSIVEAPLPTFWFTKIALNMIFDATSPISSSHPTCAYAFHLMIPFLESSKCNQNVSRTDVGTLRRLKIYYSSMTGSTIITVPIFPAASLLGAAASPSSSFLQSSGGASAFSAFASVASPASQQQLLHNFSNLSNPAATVSSLNPIRI